MATKAAFGFGTPFEEQLAFFRQKLNLPSERWDDIIKSAHDRAFIVAGATKADLLNDLRSAVDKAIAQGTGLEQFRKDFRQIVAKHGWTGWTGEGSKAGEAWRTKVIYQTNMATSYAAGRWQQLTHPNLLKTRPYWRYVHADGVMNPRPQHQAWNGLVLPYDHPFWKTHFPPNGWGCHCRVVAATRDEYEQALAEGKGVPPSGWDEVSPKTGVSVGIDNGFDYAPGASVLRPMKDFIDQKLVNLAAPIGAEMWKTIRPVLMDEQAAAVREMVSESATSMEPKGASVVAHVFSPLTVSDLATRGVNLSDAAIWLRDHELIHALRDVKVDRGAALPVEVWLGLTEYLDQATPYFDPSNRNLIYVFELQDGNGKIAVNVNYSAKIRDDGKRKNILSNFIVTGGVINQDNITGGGYVELAK